jgi:hypothetical protein
LLELQPSLLARRATPISAWPARCCSENIAAGIGGVTVVAYFSALCDLGFTPRKYALISAGRGIVGRFLTAQRPARWWSRWAM